MLNPDAPAWFPSADDVSSATSTISTEGLPKQIGGRRKGQRAASASASTQENKRSTNRSKSSVDPPNKQTRGRRGRERGRKRDLPPQHQKKSLLQRQEAWPPLPSTGPPTWASSTGLQGHKTKTTPRKSQDIPWSTVAPAFFFVSWGTQRGSHHKTQNEHLARLFCPHTTAVKWLSPASALVVLPFSSEAAALAAVQSNNERDITVIRFVELKRVVEEGEGGSVILDYRALPRPRAPLPAPGALRFLMQKLLVLANDASKLRESRPVMDTEEHREKHLGGWLKARWAQSATSQSNGQSNGQAPGPACEQNLHTVAENQEEDDESSEEEDGEGRELEREGRAEREGGGESESRERVSSALAAEASSSGVTPEWQVADFEEVPKHSGEGSHLDGRYDDGVSDDGSEEEENTSSDEASGEEEGGSDDLGEGANSAEPALTWHIAPEDGGMEWEVLSGADVESVSSDWYERDLDVMSVTSASDAGWSEVDGEEDE